MLHFRLFSFVVAVFTASGLLWLNIAEHIPPNGMPYRLSGWPITAIKRFDEPTEFKLYKHHQMVEMTENSQLLFKMENGSLTVSMPLDYDAGSLFLNACICLALCLAALIATEFILRRRDARTKTKVVT